MVENKLKKVIFVLPSMGGGGAEKVCLNILQNIDREKFVSYLVLFEKKGKYLEDVPEDVKIFDLKKKSRFDFFKLIYRLAYKVYPEVKPDIVISFLSYTNFINIFARSISFFIKPGVIVSEHSHTSLSLKFGRLRKIKLIIVKKFYPQANKIIVVSKGIKADLIENFNIDTKKIKVIYNGINLEEIEKLSREPVTDKFFNDDIPVIVACGRLTPQKNYSLLLNAFYRVTRLINAKLLILGEGEEENRLIELTDTLGIKDKVFFLGFHKNPFRYIARSNVFALSSDCEGFAIVITEAMVCGVPVVSTDCPSGPGEIITDGVNGLLVPVGDILKMSDAILKLLTDKKLAKSIGEAGRRRAEDFNVDKMVKEYEKCFLELLQEQRL